MIRLDTARKRMDDAVWATVVLKACSILLTPPRKKAIPRTKSKFESIEPNKDVCTIKNWFWNKAMIETINSTAFLFTISRQISRQRFVDLPKGSV